MISFTIDQLYLWINAFLWPFFRVLGLFMVAPLFSESSIPLQVKVGAAVLISLVIAPTLAPMPALPTASWEALWLALQQVLIGIALGFVLL